MKRRADGGGALKDARSVTHHVYRTYLIRWSVFTFDKPSNRVWVEKDSAFICWADDVDSAKRKIDEVAS